MRRNETNRWALAMLLAGSVLAPCGVRAQRVPLLAPDQVWKYNEPTAGILDGSGWANPGYHDAAWPAGRATLAWETTAVTLGFLRTHAPTNTLLEPPSGRTVYVRTTFHWTGATEGVVLVLSNLVDDGAVFYLNGVEQARLRLPTGVADVWSLFATNTPPGGDATAWEVVTLGATNLVAGTNVLAASVHQNSVTSSDVVFGLMAEALRPFAPVLADASQPTNAVVEQTRRHELMASADGFPEPSYQWFFQPAAGGGFSAVGGATNASLPILDMQAANAGHYYCRVQNSVGVTFSRTNGLDFLADTQPPTLIAAVRQPDITNLIVTFSEPMGADALDLFSYLVCTDDRFVDCVTVRATSDDGQRLRFVAGSDDTQVWLATELPLNVDQPYILAVTGGSDRTGNAVVDLPMTNVFVPNIATFRQGLNGYTGTVDTHLRKDQPETAFGANTQVLVDSLNPISHGLLRFDDLIGSAPGQVPYAAVIRSATLSLRTLNATRTNEYVQVHRMLQSWRDTDTWASPWGAGLRADGEVAVADRDARINPAVTNVTMAVDVTPSVQAWAEGQLNYGWFFTNTMSDGYQFASAEHATAEWRPWLMVDYEIGPPGPVALAVEPPTNLLVVLQGQPFAIACGVRGPQPHFQWFHDEAELPGETNATLVVAAAAPADAGEYYLRVTNDYPSAVFSSTITVQVLVDLEPPMLVAASATGRTNLTTLTLEFSEAVNAAAAVRITNYSLVPTAVITGASLVNPWTVTLSLQVPFGHRHTVSVAEGITDLHGNPIGPPGNRLEVATLIQPVEWASVWRYSAANTDELAANYLAPAFDDTAWAAGPGVLGNEAVGGVPWRTIVAATNVTSYYRHQFLWPYAPDTLDPNVAVRARHLVDDGVVCHLNGNELFRFKMPPGPVTHTTLSDNTELGDEAVLATNQVSLADLQTGLNTLAADLHPVNATSSDNVFGLEVLAVLPPKTPVRIVSVPPTNPLVVAQGRAFYLEFGADGFDPRFQWIKDNVALAAATSNGYGQTYAALGDAGDYYLQVTNSFPSATNSPVIHVTVLADTVVPLFVSALRQFDPVQVKVTFSESVHPGPASEPGNYCVFPEGNPAAAMPVVGVVLGNANTIATLHLAQPVPAGYVLAISNVTDLALNPLTPHQQPIRIPSLFQQGREGYAGTVDTHLRQDEPDAAFGTAARVLVDGNNPISHGLLRFDGVIGPPSIGAGATIHSATLRLYTDNAGDTVVMHRLLAPWDETSTWNSLGSNGVVANDVIASAMAAASFSPGPDTLDQYLEVDVTASVQAWATGAVNYGWAMLNTGTDGYQFPSADASEQALRPTLLVDWTDSGVCVPVALFTPPAAVQTIPEGEPVVFDVAVFGSVPTYQWQKDGVDLPDATNWVFTLAAVVPADAGMYRCVVSNRCPSVLVSPHGELQVIADVVGPALLTARARGSVTAPELSQVVLTFDQALAVAGAETPGHYTVHQDGLGFVSVQAAELLDSRTVRLTLEPALVFGRPATLGLGAGVTDTAVARNPAEPGPFPIAQQVVALEYTTSWRYDETRNATDNYDTAVPAWYVAGFNDATWASGAGIFALEDDADVLELLPAPSNTPLTVTAEAIYLRTRFTWPFGTLPAQADFVVNHLVDDGLIAYLNGAEAFRFKMDDGPVAHTNQASAGGEAVLAWTNLPAARVLATNLLACGLHPFGSDSSDAVFGLEVLAQYPGPVSGNLPRLTITRTDGNQLTLAWQPDTGVLQMASNPAGPWTDVPEATNPMELSAGSGLASFFSVRP